MGLSADAVAGTLQGRSSANLGHKQLLSSNLLSAFDVVVDARIAPLSEMELHYVKYFLQIGSSDETGGPDTDAEALKKCLQHHVAEASGRPAPEMSPAARNMLQGYFMVQSFPGPTINTARPTPFLGPHMKRHIPELCKYGRISTETGNCPGGPRGGSKLVSQRTTAFSFSAADVAGLF
jgi:hypothetical protein